MRWTPAYGPWSSRPPQATTRSSSIRAVAPWHMKVLVNEVAPGTFSPTGRLIASGGDGGDVQVACPHRQRHAGAADHLPAFRRALEELRKVARTSLREVTFVGAGRLLAAKVAGAAGDVHQKAGAGGAFCSPLRRRANRIT